MIPRKSPAPAIAGAGVCCLDHVFIAPQISWGQTTQIQDYRVQGGGLVGTALVACARLGAQCRLFSYLGNDEVGIRVAAELAAEGISLAGVLRGLRGSSPFSFIHVDNKTGERTIFHRPAQVEEDTGLPDFEWIAQSDALLIDDYYPELSLAAAQAARRKGVPVIADTTINPEKRMELFQAIDVLIVPRSFAERYGFGSDLAAAIRAMHRLGPTTVIITLGKEGWVFSSPEEKGHGKAFKVDVVDTTGAGDAFHGAFAYALARGWGVERCAEFAAAVAAIKCTRVGGRTGLPSLTQIMIFLKKKSRLDWTRP
ncbi:MAG: PfkB family carbohydrate kinase [Acidobacteriota bacterium]